MKQLSAEITELLNKKSTIDFLSAARQFVTLLENGDLSQETFYKDSHKALSELYRTALNLETVELIHSGPDSEFDEIDKDELRKINKNLISNLGKDCFYWEVFDPTYTEENGKPGQGWKITDREPTQGWLVDDFADIYADLKEELTKIDQIGTDESIEDALWQLKFGFNHHWGNHCINAMRAFHYLWYDGKVAM
ncbi:MAG: DUF5063 domain-containing protein [Cyclobacteriaceae bacterium]